jgi:hypothetical protein
VNICPKSVTIRRVKGAAASDTVDIKPVSSIANINKIIVNIDEPVNIKFLRFHKHDDYYCNKYKLLEYDKCYCNDIKTHNFVHFYITIEESNNKAIILAFLPRNKTEVLLRQVANEICDICEWLEEKQNVNCIVFRYGKPVHRSDNKFKWARQLSLVLKEAREHSTMAGSLTSRVNHISEETSLKVQKTRTMTIKPGNSLDCINVS